MKLVTQLKCPVSPERVDENRVRVTALGVVFVMGAYFVTGFALFPALLHWSLLAYISGSVLVLFAFLECGLNFCMGCWVYSYLVYPLVRKNRD
jgi:hypothetical protein